MYIFFLLLLHVIYFARHKNNKYTRCGSCSQGDKSRQYETKLIVQGKCDVSRHSQAVWDQSRNPWGCPRKVPQRCQSNWTWKEKTEEYDQKWWKNQRTRFKFIMTHFPEGEIREKVSFGFMSRSELEAWVRKGPQEPSVALL